MLLDGRIVGLVKEFLKSGILSEDGETIGTMTGTPQGGILTPPTQWITGAQKGVVSHGDAVPDDHAFGARPRLP
jgi:hypothetical protein